MPAEVRGAMSGNISQCIGNQRILRVVEIFIWSWREIWSMGELLGPDGRYQRFFYVVSAHIRVNAVWKTSVCLSEKLLAKQIFFSNRDSLRVSSTANAPNLPSLFPFQAIFSVFTTIKEIGNIDNDVPPKNEIQKELWILRFYCGFRKKKEPVGEIVTTK